jgi:hypothetical protein
LLVRHRPLSAAAALLLRILLRPAAAWGAAGVFGQVVSHHLLLPQPHASCSGCSSEQKDKDSSSGAREV